MRMVMPRSVALTRSLRRARAMAATEVTAA
jgi:hypothetical protein